MLSDRAPVGRAVLPTQRRIFSSYVIPSITKPILPILFNLVNPAF